jgi:CubicO group peptidase (beta-lactamase class C family)
MIKERVFAFIGILYLLTGPMLMAQQAESLPRSLPEKEGVPSASILRFVQEMEKSKNEFHSLMILRHGKVIAEGSWDPYRKDVKQALYSVSKSFTSTAVGFAVSEGRLSVNDKVVSFFPGDLPDTISPWLAGLTVKDLLCMQEGQDSDRTRIIGSGSAPWVRGFLKIPIAYKPGTHFLYNTMGVYILAAIVEKRTGQHLIDYLRPRLFDPLGITGEDWEVSPQGIDVGGWGLRLRTEDLAKMGQLYLQKGVWKGRQLLPKQWIEEATTAHNNEGSPVDMHYEKDSSDWNQGYGYLFWRCRHDVYRADGAYGQYIMVFPDQDAVVAMTSETSDMQDEMNLVWRYLLPAMQDGALPADPEAAGALHRKLSTLALPVRSGNKEGSTAGAIAGKWFSIPSNELGLGSVKFGFNNGICRLDLKIDSAVQQLVFGAGRWEKGETNLPAPNLSPLSGIRLAPFRVAGSYRWIDDHNLELTLRYIQSPHSETILCRFDQHKLRMTIEKSLDFGKKSVVLEGEVKGY